MRQILWMTSLAVLAACAQPADRNASAGASLSPRAHDRQLLREMVDHDLAEMAAGKLAAAKAKRPEIKVFAQQMTGEHSVFLGERKQMAKARRIPLPDLPDPQHQDALAGLESLSASAFDRAYVASQVSEQASALQVLREAASSAADPALRKHAEDTLPSVQADLKRARILAAQLGSATS